MTLSETTTSKKTFDLEAAKKRIAEAAAPAVTAPAEKPAPAVKKPEAPASPADTLAAQAAAKAADKAAEKEPAEKPVKSTMEYTMEKITVAEWIDRDLILPVFQRGFVWSAQQEIDLLDSLAFSGVPLPAFILCRIARQSGKTEFLLIDGHQRDTAIRRIIDGEGPNSEASQEVIDAVLDAPVSVMTVDVPDDETAGLLFRRYNSGAVLTGLQRTKSLLPAEVATAVIPYLTGYKAIAQGASKVGKAPTEAAALMLAAALADPSKASTSGAVAGKVLCAPGTKVPDWDASIEAALTEGLKDAQPSGYWYSPAHMVPLFSALHKGGIEADAEDIANYAEAFPARQAGKYAVALQKGKKTEVVETSVMEAFNNTSNAHKATAVRQQVLAQDLKKFISDASANAALKSALEALDAAEEETK